MSQKTRLEKVHDVVSNVSLFCRVIFCWCHNYMVCPHFQAKFLRNWLLNGPELYWYCSCDSEWVTWHWCWRLKKRVGCCLVCTRPRYTQELLWKLKMARTMPTLKRSWDNGYTLIKLSQTLQHQLVFGNKHRKYGWMRWECKCLFSIKIFIGVLLWPTPGYITNW